MFLRRIYEVFFKLVFSFLFAIIQRRQTQTLISQLNALTSTHEILKSSHGSMEENLASTQRRLQEQSQELAATKHDLQVSQERLRSAEEELKTSRVELSFVSQDREAVTAALSAERGEGKRKVGNLKKGLGLLSDRSVFSSFYFFCRLNL